ncbi:hypothetical protein BDN72DRAFT_846705 [Pluteus cervinus]|uniref:Uncharacterized protein n=1 Tax=Pluteus cervinus TaxID=181527 RepID=A0ACD3AEZ9_9AGAR|nr:hypothetical protein BDN72DRAFT_846705 [Pluteus cervinus]
MSLPAALKDISDHPARGSVVDPVDKHAKDADVDRKIRLYGVISALRKGRYPTNKQIDSTLQYVLKHSPVDQAQLSPEGKKIVQDTKDIIETARIIVQQKNADELVQKFLWHTRRVDRRKVDLSALQAQGSQAVDRESIQSEGSEAAEHLRTLLTLILTNSEVRKLLSDFSLIGRDLLARSAAKAAGIISPDEEAMRDIDKAAPSDTFHTSEGRTAGPEETPVLEARLPGTDAKVQQHPREDQPIMQGEDGERMDLSQVRDNGQTFKDEAKQHVAGEGQALREEAADATERARDGDDVALEDKKGGLMDRVRGIRDNLTDKIPQQHKDTAQEHYDRGRKFLSDEYFPEERRDQFIYRGKKAILECQRHDDYQASMRWMLDHIDQYLERGTEATGKGKSGISEFTQDPNLQSGIEELRTILERFADGRSLNIVIDAIDKLADDARRDESLRNWFRQVDAYMRKCLLQPGYILDKSCNNDGNELREHGRRFYDLTYKGHFDDLFDSIGTWFKGMGEDPLNVRFGEDWSRLTRDLLFDKEGSLAFKSELWNDVRKVILPTLVDEIGYIPIPRIEYTDDSWDLVVENLTLSGRNLFPNIVSVEAHNFVKFSPYNAISDESHHRFTLTLGQIQADMRDVAFYFKKKSGLPRLSDSGLADVIMGGEGMKIIVGLASAQKDRSSVFHVEDVYVKVDQVKIAIRDSKHDLLYKTLRPLMTGLVKRQIQKAVSDMIRTGFEYIDGQLVRVRDTMDSAKSTEGDSRTKALQEMFQRNKDGVGSIRSTDSQSQFKVVSNKRDSLLATAGHPAGWINRTAEKEELAEKGTEWRSDAFTIV